MAYVMSGSSGSGSGITSIDDTTPTSLNGALFGFESHCESDSNITTDGLGNLLGVSFSVTGTTNSLSGNGLNISDGDTMTGNIVADGNLQVRGTLSTDLAAITSDGFGGLTVGTLAAGSGGLSVIGTTSLDSNGITTNGAGTLTAASLHTDGVNVGSGNISLDTSGNITGVRLFLTGLPTTDPMVSGAVWSNAGVLSISP